MKTKSLAALLVVGAAAAGGYYYWQTYKPELSFLKPRPVTTSTVEVVDAPVVSVVKASVADFVETAGVSGSLVAREETLVSPEIEGFRVLELNVEEGMEVKKGQVLARLVPDQLEAQTAQMDANKARAEAAIAQARSQLTEAEARFKEAQAQLERAEPLKKQGYLSGSVYDQRESAAHTAEAQVAAARDGLKATEAGLAQVNAQRRELDWKLGNTEIKAPTDGIVSRRTARIGALASGSGEPMFRIISNGEIELDAEIVETDLGKVHPGQKAHITVPGVGDLDGKVRLVSTEVDKTTRIGHARIFLGKNPSLRIGAFARGTIDTADSRGVAIPPSALQFETDGAFVLVVGSDNTVDKRQVTTGLVSKGIVEIKSGLKEGDVVVARAGTFLRSGDRIAPVPLTKTAGPETAEAK